MNVPTHSKVPPCPIRRPIPDRRRRSRLRSKLVGWAVATVVVALVAGYFAPRSRAVRSDLLTEPVRYDRLQATIAEHGILQAATTKDIVCQVKARNHGSTVATVIKWVIEEGTTVNKDDVVAELDSSALEVELRDQKIVVLKARSDWLQAQENQKLVSSQSQSELEAAGIASQLADLDLEKYLKGDYEQTRKDIEGRLAMAQSDRERSQDRAAWSELMLRKGFYTPNQTQNERDRVVSAELALEKVKEEQRVLEQFTRRRTVTELQNNAVQGRLGLIRVRHQARAKELQADVDCLTKLSVLNKEEQRLRELEDQIRNCTLRAPQAGIVVYHNSDQRRSGSGSQQGMIAQGEPVREGQILLQIPDLASMEVDTQVHESVLARVRGEERLPSSASQSVSGKALDVLSLFPDLLEPRDLEGLREKGASAGYSGDPALIQLHAYPGRIFHGHVKRVSNVPLQREWYLTNAKLYSTLVAVDDPGEDLKPGMTADVTIYGDRPLEHVLTVPVGSIFGKGKPGESVKCYVLTEEGPQEREIVLGLGNDTKLQVKAGLEEGDEIVLNPESLRHEQEAPISP